jgi:hypothetical protein
LLEAASVVGVGGGLEGGDNLDPLAMLDNIYTDQKPDHELGKYHRPRASFPLRWKT